MKNQTDASASVFFMSIVLRLFFCVGTVEIVFVVMFISAAGTLFSLGGYSHLK